MSVLSVVRVPAPGAEAVRVRTAPLPREGSFPPAWLEATLTDTGDGWWQIDLSVLDLADGAYEYEFAVRRGGQWFTAADPYAEEITRFCGYRGVLHMRGGQRVRPEFSWVGEVSARSLPQNNQLIIYQLPLRWIDTGSTGDSRHVALGTFDKAIFLTLEQWILPLGVNCIELQPVQDSPETIHGGYGTRFFFAPDVDLGPPFDLKLFIRRCHERGIRVLLDMVMNHARKCPLRDMAYEWFFLRSGAEEPDARGAPRPDWGGDVFRFRDRRAGVYHAREFHFQVAEFFIREYHVDGFRVDDFTSLDNYDFAQEFAEHARHVHQQTFPGRPFVVIAEDSWSRAELTRDIHRGRRVVDSIWDVDFQHDLRQLIAGPLQPRPGELPPSQRLQRTIHVHHSGRFADMAQRVVYCTAHDAREDYQQRLFGWFLQRMAGAGRRGASEPGLARLALEQVHSALALTLTAAGIPMFLAGEEFGDLHDMPRRDRGRKAADPVDWSRARFPGHRELLSRVRQLVHLRRTHSALHRNEVQFFGFPDGAAAGFHPTFDETGGKRLFAYCRTAGHALGQPHQVVVVANLGQRACPKLWIHWPWGYLPSLKEYGGVDQPLPFADESRAVLALEPYQVRVFSS